jgi:hypothetical protein
LLDRELRIAGLRYRGAKDVEAADVLVLRSDATQRLVKTLRIAAGELGDAAHAENFEVAQHGRADRD